jgi:uncharacterized protein
MGADIVDQSRIVQPTHPRPLPEVNEMTAYFWEGGADGRLRILRCNGCGVYIHPYQAVCDKCGSTEVRPAAVSGRGTVLAVSVNHQPWFPAVPVPYVIAIVELQEQANIRLMTNLDLQPADAKAGMAVKVYFEQHGDIFVPLFEPA